MKLLSQEHGLSANLIHHASCVFCIIWTKTHQITNHSIKVSYIVSYFFPIKMSSFVLILPDAKSNKIPPWTFIFFAEEPTRFCASFIFREIWTTMKTRPNCSIFASCAALVLISSDGKLFEIIGQKHMPICTVLPWLQGDCMHGILYT